MRKTLATFQDRLPGFTGGEGQLVGVENRTSSPRVPPEPGGQEDSPQAEGDERRPDRAASRFRDPASPPPWLPGYFQVPRCAPP
jgi:hypothetical protein